MCSVSLVSLTLTYKRHPPCVESRDHISELWGPERGAMSGGNWPPTSHHQSPTLLAAQILRGRDVTKNKHTQSSQQL